MKAKKYSPPSLKWTQPELNSFNFKHLLILQAHNKKGYNYNYIPKDYRQTDTYLPTLHTHTYIRYTIHITQLLTTTYPYQYHSIPLTLRFPRPQRPALKSLPRNSMEMAHPLKGAPSHLSPLLDQHACQPLLLLAKGLGSCSIPSQKREHTEPHHEETGQQSPISSPPSPRGEGQWRPIWLKHGPCHLPEALQS